MEHVLVVLFWLGQSCFVLETGPTRILIDPYNAKLGYAVKNVGGVDAVTVTHEHFDHNNVAMAEGKPLVLRGLSDKGAGFNKIDRTVGNVRIRTVNSYHDASQGKERGRNAIFVYEIVGANPPARVVHMGDFGEKRLSAEQIAEIGAVEVLLIPVGGHFTIGPEEADEVIAALKPEIVVPMHWKTEKTGALPIQDVSPFLKGKKNVLEEAKKGNRLAVTASMLERAKKAGEPLIVPLSYGPAPAK